MLQTTISLQTLENVLVLRDVPVESVIYGYYMKSPSNAGGTGYVLWLLLNSYYF